MKTGNASFQMTIMPSGPLLMHASRGPNTNPFMLHSMAISLRNLFPVLVHGEPSNAPRLPPLRRLKTALEGDCFRAACSHLSHSPSSLLPESSTLWIGEASKRYLFERTPENTLAKYWNDPHKCCAFAPPAVIAGVVPLRSWPERVPVFRQEFSLLRRNMACTCAACSPQRISVGR